MQSPSLSLFNPAILNRSLEQYPQWKKQANEIGPLIKDWDQGYSSPSTGGCRRSSRHCNGVLPNRFRNQVINPATVE